MKSDPAGYPIHQDRVAQYFLWAHIIVVATLGLCLFIVGVVLAPLYAVTIGAWLPRMQANALRYWLEGATLRVNQGVYVLQQKAIPLDRVTDIKLVQGPLLRWCGIWALHVQTSGMGNAVAEAVLYGLVNPEEVRNELLAARDAFVARRSL